MQIQDTNSPVRKLFPPASCLITSLRDELCKLSIEEISACDIVLPTRRLILMLQAAVAKIKGAFVPGRWLTVHEYVKSQFELLDQRETVVNDTLSDRWVVRSLLQTKKFKTLRVGQEKQILQFFKELGDHSQNIRLIDEMREVLQRDIFRSSDQISTQHQRLDDLKVLWRDTETKIRAQGRAPSYLEFQHLVHILLESWQPEKGRRLIFAGHTSVGDLFLPLFAKFAQAPSTEFWMHGLPDSIDLTFSPLTKLFHAIGGTDNELLIRSNESGSVGQIFGAGSISEEVKLCVERLQGLQDQGLAASQIGILVPDESTYEPLLRNWVQSNNVTSNLALSHDLRSTQRGLWLSSLVAYLLRSSDPLLLAGVGLHPITLHKLTHNSVHSFERMNTGLADSFCSDGNKGDLRQTSEKVRDPASREACQRLEALLRPLLDSKSQTLHAWWKDFESLAGEFELLHDRFESDRGLRDAFANYWQDLGTSMELASPLLGAISTTEFLTLLQQSLESDLRTQGEPFTGVQILTLSEARHVPFAALLILGCTEGTFPRQIPPDYLIDSYLKRAVDLPAWQNFDAMEELTFTLMDQRVPHIDLFYTKDEEQARSRSRFIDRLLQRGTHGEYQPGEIEKSITEPPYLRPLIAHDPAPADFLPMSATSLEALIQCPFKFILKHWGVRKLDLPGTTKQREEGNALHQILEWFFAGTESGSLPPLKAGGHYQPEELLERLRVLTKELFSDHDAASNLQLHWHSWSKLVEFFGPLLNAHTFTSHSEYKIHTSEVKGKIDQVLQLGDHFLIIDHKRQSAREAKDIALGSSIQLPFYAWALSQIDPEKFHPEKMILGYWKIYQGAWEGRGVGKDSKDFADETKLYGGRAKVSEMIEAMLASWQWRKDEIAQEKGFLPDDSRRNCDYCASFSICRKSDPNYSSFFVGHRKYESRRYSNESD